MLEFVTIVSVLGAVLLLGLLSRIDLKIGLLPNELVLGFAVLGLVFHVSTVFHFMEYTDMILGALVGGGILLIIRLAANWHYKDDTLGLGDVKLLGAAGIWLGPYYILIALTLGAMAGVVHGLALAFYLWTRTKIKMNLGKLSLPAGPGFAVGIVLAGCYAFWDLPDFILGQLR